MATTPNPGQLERKIERLQQRTGDTVEGKITVLWGGADPENRPTGMTWVPETNTLTYDLWEAQRDALEAVESGEHDIVAKLAGYGSGKTIFGARWLIKQAIEHPGSRFLAMGIDFQKARDTTFRVLFEQLPGERTGVVTSSYNGPETSPLVQDYNRQNHRLTLVNDTVIKLGSADKWNRYAGDEYGGIWLDEPSHYGEDLHNLLEMLGSRLRGVEGPKVQLWTLTGNSYNAAYDILENREDKTGDAIGLHIAKIRASTLDNPYLDESDKERFERQYGGTSREIQALYGGFAEAAGAILSYGQLSFMDRDALADETPDRWKYHVGIDLAYVDSRRKAEANDTDYTALVLIGVNTSAKQAYVLGAEQVRGLSMRQSIEWVQQCIQDVPYPYIKVEDVGAQRFWIQEAQRELPGTVQPVKPKGSKEARIQDMSVLFERGDCVLLNRDVDENLGYDPTLRAFVRQWCEFGASDGSPDLLDAAYYALSDVRVGGDLPTVYSTDPYKDKRQHSRPNIMG